MLLLLLLLLLFFNPIEAFLQSLSLHQNHGHILITVKEKEEERKQEYTIYITTTTSAEEIEILFSGSPKGSLVPQWNITINTRPIPTKINVITCKEERNFLVDVRPKCLLQDLKSSKVARSRLKSLT